MNLIHYDPDELDQVFDRCWPRLAPRLLNGSAKPGPRGIGEEFRLIRRTSPRPAA